MNFELIRFIILILERAIRIMNRFSMFALFAHGLMFSGNIADEWLSDLGVHTVLYLKNNIQMRNY